MAGRTPGPWIVGPADAIQWDGEVTVYPIQPEDDPRGWIAETYTEANARFIAAAPDMPPLLERSLPYLPMGLAWEIQAVLARANGKPEPSPLGYDTAGPGTLADIDP